MCGNLWASERAAIVIEMERFGLIWHVHLQYVWHNAWTSSAKKKTSSGRREGNKYPLCPFYLLWCTYLFLILFPRPLHTSVACSILGK